MREDYYELLDVEKTASEREIRAAYRRLAMQLHPDHNDGNAAAEERFKLVCEAWRTLGHVDLRADYDDWLERHKRYSSLPELAEMPRRRSRVSARHGEERKRSRGRYHSRQPLLRHGARLGMWQYAGVCVLGLIIIVPVMIGTMKRAVRQLPPAPTNGLPPGESPLPPDEQKRVLSRHLLQVRTAAESGDAAAQFRYGNLLNTGIAALDMAPDRATARIWWERSAAQGYRPALNLLKALEHFSGAPAAGDHPVISAPDGKKSTTPQG